MPQFELQDRARVYAGLEAVAHVSAAQKDLLANLPRRVVSIAECEDIQAEGSAPTEACLVLSGLVCRYKLVGDGKRQIVSLHLPGDLPDLQSLYLDTTDYGVAALSAARVAFIPHEALRQLIAHEPDIGQLLVRLIAVDGSIFREWIANIGRRDAPQRMAHLLCEFFVRLRTLGFASDNVMSLPLTQTELGDATGISAVHVNRVLQQLRRRGLITSRGNHHRINDWAALARAGDFTAGYLHLRPSMAQLGLS